MVNNNTILEALQNETSRREAFELLVRTYQQPLYHTIRRIVISHEDTDDVLQNTFIKAWRGLDSFRGDASISTWLYRIATHEALDFLNQQKRKAHVSIDNNYTVEGLTLADQLESDPYFDGDETARQLQEAISTLPHKQRIVFNMRYFEDKKYEEMSDILDTSVGALKASYHHAVQKITAFFNLND